MLGDEKSDAPALSYRTPRSLPLRRKTLRSSQNAVFAPVSRLDRRIAFTYNRPMLSPSSITKLSGFLFDLDGTLVETPIDFAGMKRGVSNLAESLGLDPKELQAFDILGMIEEAERRLEGKSLPRSFREQAESLLTRYELEAASVAKELPGASETLITLKERSYQVGIVTRNSKEGALLALDRVPLPYDVLLTRRDAPRPKPDPDPLLRAARRMETPPDRCAMVGDHPMDMRAGRAAGMLCIAVQTRDPSPQAFADAQPDAILPGVKDLLSWMSASSS
jgi:phosphoglycolate phosphatase